MNHDEVQRLMIILLLAALVFLTAYEKDGLIATGGALTGIGGVVYFFLEMLERRLTSKTSEGDDRAI